MNRTASTPPCPFCRPGSKTHYTEESDVGITDDGWDITRMTCTSCGTAWLRAYRGQDMYPRAGRYFRVPVKSQQIENLTASAALQLIESSELRLVGGSRYSHVECLDEGPQYWFVKSKQASPALI
jgi:hypothetical protein